MHTTNNGPIVDMMGRLGSAGPPIYGPALALIDLIAYVDTMY